MGKMRDVEASGPKREQKVFDLLLILKNRVSVTPLVQFSSFDFNKRLYDAWSTQRAKEAEGNTTPTFLEIKDVKGGVINIDVTQLIAWGHSPHVEQERRAPSSIAVPGISGIPSQGQRM